MNIIQALKTDIALNKDIQVTPGGDISSVSGLPNLKLALFHRLVTVPGSLVHRPTYGVGISAYQNAPNSFALQQKLAALVQEQFEQDPRVESVSSVSISSTDSNPQQVNISVVLTPVGYTEQTMVFALFNEDTA